MLTLVFSFNYTFIQIPIFKSFKHLVQYHFFKLLIIFFTTWECPAEVQTFILQIKS